MIFSTHTILKNKKIEIPDEITKTLSIDDDQELYHYYEKHSKRLFLSTIPLSEKLYWFRIPFRKDIKPWKEIYGIFQKYNGNIEKSDDASLGRYVTWDVWVTFKTKYTDLDEFDDSFAKLLIELKQMVPRYLQENAVRITNISFS